MVAMISFSSIDDWYYDNDAMDDLMDEYVKNHPEEFVIDVEYDYYEQNYISNDKQMNRICEKD